MSNCPLHCAAHVLSQWWSVRPLFHSVRFLRRLIGEEDMRRSAINALGLKPGDRVLNMCAGLGDNLHLLAECGLELYAADTKIDNAEACRREIRENHWQNIRAIHWTDTRLPFPNASIDAIFITYGLTGTNNPGYIIAECERLLKPDGRIVVIDWITPGKGNGILAGLLWPLHFLMGCNPYTPWRRQLARAFEVCKQQNIWADMATFTYAVKRLSTTDTDKSHSDNSTPQPSNAFCGVQHAMAHKENRLRREDLETKRQAASEPSADSGNSSPASETEARQAGTPETDYPQKKPLQTEQPKTEAPKTELQETKAEPAANANADVTAEAEPEQKQHPSHRDKKFRLNRRKNR